MDYNLLTKLLSFNERNTIELVKILSDRKVLPDDIAKQILEKPSDQGATLLSENIKVVLDDPNAVLDTALVQELRKHEFLEEFTQDLQPKLKTSKQSDSVSPTVASTSTRPVIKSSPGHAHSTQPRGGYEDDLFIEKPPETFRCPICLLTLREPHLLDCCRALICEDCLECSSDKFCPACKSTSFTSILDKRTRGNIMSLKVKCKNDPCSWTGELLDLKPHLDTVCQFARVSCPRGCGLEITRSEFVNHLENVCELRVTDGRLENVQTQLWSSVSKLTHKFDEESFVKRKLVSQFQLFLDHQYDVLMQQAIKSESDAAAEAVGDVKDQMNELLGRQTDKMSEMKTSFDNTVQHIKKPVEDNVMKNNEKLRFIEILETTRNENDTQKQRIKDLQNQPLRLMDRVDKFMMKVKMAHMKDVEIDKLKKEMKKLQEEDGSKIKKLEKEKEELQEKLNLQAAQELEAQEDQLEKEKQKMSKENTSEFGMQFDYWIPMEDLLHGAVVVSENVFNVHGDKEQIFNWTDCGFSLEVPQGALSPDETCPVAIKALISGRFMFPKGFQLLSAVYAISPGGKFKKDVKATIQHCLQLEREEQLERLCFAKAYPTLCNTANPYYVFEIAKGGKFQIGSQLCEIWQRDFCHFCVGIRARHDDDDDEDTDTSGTGSGAEEQEQGLNEDAGEHEENEHEGENPSTPRENDDEEPPQDDDDVEEPPNQDEEEEERNSESTSSLTTPPPLATPPAETTPPLRATQPLLSKPPSLNLPPSVTTPPVTTIPSSLATPSSTATSSNQVSSTSEDGSSREDAQLYRAHFFYKKTSTNAWDFQLVTIKQLDVHIKFITDKYVDEEQISSFGFRFASPSIKLNFPDRDKLPTGWVITPLTIPCSVSKEDIDTLSPTEVTVQSHEQQRVYCDIPMCKASVYAEDRPSTVSHIEYCVEITGIKQTKSVVIARRKSNNSPDAVSTSAVVSNPVSQPIESRQDADENNNVTIEQMKDSVKGAIQKKYPALKNIFEGNIRAISAEMIAEDIITSSHNTETTFDKIINDFYGGMEFQDDIDELKDWCNRFFKAMIKIGGPVKIAAEKLKKSIKHL